MRKIGELEWATDIRTPYLASDTPLLFLFYESKWLVI